MFSIFDLNASDVNAVLLTHPVSKKIEQNRDYFFRICSYDGYDYSDWSWVHGFYSSSNKKPILEITEDGYNIKDYNIGYDMTEVIDSIKNCPTYNSAYRWGNLLEKILLTGVDYIEMCMNEYDRLRKEDGVIEDSLDYWNKALSACNIF